MQIRLAETTLELVTGYAMMHAIYGHCIYTYTYVHSTYFAPRGTTVQDSDIPQLSPELKIPHGNTRTIQSRKLKFVSNKNKDKTREQLKLSGTNN